MGRPAFSAGEVGIDVVPLTDRFLRNLGRSCMIFVI